MRSTARVFKLHFNRLGHKRGDTDVWTVQLSGRCLHAAKIHVAVPLETIFKGDSAPQPRAFLRGRGIVKQIGDTIYIGRDHGND